MIDTNPNIDNSGEINLSLCIIISGMGYYIGFLESAMRTEGIKFDELWYKNASASHLYGGGRRFCVFREYMLHHALN